MKIPGWLELWIRSVGIALEDFEAIASSIMSKVQVPQEGQDAFALWLQEHVKVAISPERILAMGLTIYLELKGGEPGYNKDAQALP